MRKLILCIAIFALAGAACAQQEASKFDLFGGYSYFNGSTSGVADRFSLNGWNVQGTYNVNRWLGATADIGGYYGSPFHVSTHDYTFLFGPTFTVRASHVTPYVHALFGVDRFHVNVIGASGTDSAFAMAVGGGLDVPIKPKFAIRVAQVDWLRTNHFSAAQNNVRLSTGVVFRFGE